ncbi:MAG: arylsulfatase [Planctomycetales bacterium]|nr:arylsulfatase [Planctomycetales bacterium]
MMKMLGVPLCLVAILAAAHLRAAENPAPNIVYVLCDDLGYGDVQALNPQRARIPTPSMNRLAEEGMAFTDAHASCSVCTPSRYSILTGRYSWRTKLQQGVLGGFGRPLLDQRCSTVAQFLRENGYDTACIGKWHLGLGFGPDRYTTPIQDGPPQHGFGYFYGISASLDMAPFAWIDHDRFPEKPSVTKHFFRDGIAAPGFEAIDVLPALTEQATRYVRGEDRHRDKPFFLYLPLTAPHTPIVPTEAWRGKSGLGDYGDFVMQVDNTVGEVLQAIEAAGLGDNTLVIVTSDNGFAPAAGPKRLEEQGHYPSAHFRGYKSDIWEGGHRVPLIVRWPGVVRPGTRCGQLVGLIDLFATTAEVLGQEVPPHVAVDSFSMLPLLQGSDSPVREAHIHHSNDGYFAVRKGDWKLELCAGSGGWSRPREPRARAMNLPKVQLYNLADDPGEETNVASQHPERVQELSDCLSSAINRGRTTPGPTQPNDVEVVVYK